eukprot:767311-Hanusia_phi.AAC.2
MLAYPAQTLIPVRITAEVGADLASTSEDTRSKLATPLLGSPKSIPRASWTSADLSTAPFLLGDEPSAAGGSVKFAHLLIVSSSRQAAPRPASNSFSCNPSLPPCTCPHCSAPRMP